MKLSNVTIIKYLKQGTLLNWCHYDAKEEMRRASSKSGKLRGKKVEIFKDSISLGIFASCTELDRRSKELFGIKLNFKNISAVCLNANKLHNGFSFKYV